MKKNLVYLFGCFSLFATIFFFSCDNGNDSINMENNQSTTKKLQRTGSTDYKQIVVGNVDSNGDFIISGDLEEMLDNWNYNLLTYAGIDAQLESVEIFQNSDGDYFIKGKGQLYKSTVPLVMNSIYGGYTGLGIACTSRGCSDDSKGCVPKADKKSCTDCALSDCSKTVTAHSGDPAAMFDYHLAATDIGN